MLYYVIFYFIEICQDSFENIFSIQFLLMMQYSAVFKGNFNYTMGFPHFTLFRLCMIDIDIQRTLFDIY